jgi:dihydropteroate synthase
MEPYAAKIVGILNVTEDSFSDGGRYLDAAAAIAHGRTLRADGADWIDVGAASSRPDAKEVESTEEIRRLAPVLAALRAHGIPVSVDTRSPETQRYCLGHGVEMLNDVDGFAHPSLYPDLARATAKLVVMHSIQGGGRATRVETDAEAVFAAVIAFFSRRLAELETAGIARERLIVDPGMGLFLGQNPEPSLRVLRRLEELRHRFGLPVLVSVSRKSFLRELTGRAVAERGAATLAAEIWAAGEGADYIRTHDVRALSDALAVLRALRKDSAP